jgi:hypothetical protein
LASTRRARGDRYVPSANRKGRKADAVRKGVGAWPLHVGKMAKTLGLAAPEARVAPGTGSRMQAVHLGGWVECIR